MLLSTNRLNHYFGFLPKSIRAGSLLMVGALFAPAVQSDELDPQIYDLNSRHGVLAVYQRVQTIAEHHCVADSELAVSLNHKERTCRDRVLAQLLGKLADPYLSYLHDNPEAQRLAQR